VGQKVGWFQTTLEHGRNRHVCVRSPSKATSKEGSIEKDLAPTLRVSQERRRRSRGPSDLCQKAGRACVYIQNETIKVSKSQFDSGLKILYQEVMHPLVEKGVCIKKKKGTVALLTILVIICVILTKWSLAHFAKLRGLSTSSQDAY
jgi:hypothetical protein